MTPDPVYDLLIGAGCARKLVFSRAATPGSARCTACATRWRRLAAAAGDRGAQSRGSRQRLRRRCFRPAIRCAAYAGSDLPKVNPIKSVTCPFTGEVLAAVPSVRPDVTVIHAQKADRKGNVLIQASLACRREAALAAKRCIVTVGESSTTSMRR